jgi:hypothetical protein
VSRAVKLFKIKQLKYLCTTPGPPSPFPKDCMRDFL